MQLHTYYASSPGVKASVLIREGIRNAKYENGGGDWELESLDEYHSEVLDEKGNVVDETAKVVLRRTDSK